MKLPNFWTAVDAGLPYASTLAMFIILINILWFVPMVVWVILWIVGPLVILILLSWIFGIVLHTAGLCEKEEP